MEFPPRISRTNPQHCPGIFPGICQEIAGDLPGLCREFTGEPWGSPWAIPAHLPGDFPRIHAKTLGKPRRRLASWLRFLWKTLQSSWGRLGQSSEAFSDKCPGKSCRVLGKPRPGPGVLSAFLGRCPGESCQLSKTVCFHRFCCLGCLGRLQDIRRTAASARAARKRPAAAKLAVPRKRPTSRR